MPVTSARALALCLVAAAACSKKGARRAPGDARPDVAATSDAIDLGKDVIRIRSLEAERIQAGDDATTAARSAIFPLWSASAQVQPLWEVIGRSAATDRPLELAGFDSQFTGAFSRRDLVPELGKATGDPKAAEAVRAVVSHGGAGSTSERERERQRVAIRALSGRVSGPRAPFWKQLLRSTLAQAEAQWSEEGRGLLANTSAASNNPRDAQMADNLHWLATQQYPDRKIIVWGATMHLMRNARTVEQKGLLWGRSRPYEELATRGDHVSAVLGDDVYTIGFLAYEGRWAWAGNSTFADTVPPAPPDSFEDLFFRAGIENGFLDLRRDPSRFAVPRLARPCGYAEMIGDWTRIVDGFVFTRTMTPSATAP